MAISTKLYNFGGVVAYSVNVTDTDMLEDMITVLASGEMVYNLGWRGEAPNFSQNTYELESAFYNKVDYITDYSKLTIAINVWDESSNDYSDMVVLRNIISACIENGLDVSKNYLYLCPRFNFMGELKPTYESIINNTFYRVSFPKNFQVKDIGIAGAGKQQKLTFSVLDYSDNLGYDDAELGLYELTFDDGDGDVDLSFDDGDGETYDGMIIE